MRKPDWPIILDREIQAAKTLPFSYGEHDCATWAFDLRHSLIGGENPADRWRGRYRTEKGCARVMKRLGWSTVEEGALELLGNPLASVLMAQRGDIVLMDGALGICIGSEAAFVGVNGLEASPLRACQTAWRV